MPLTRRLEKAPAGLLGLVGCAEAVKASGLCCGASLGTAKMIGYFLPAPTALVGQTPGGQRSLLRSGTRKFGWKRRGGFETYFEGYASATSEDLALDGARS
jgi:hypothetical protein